MTRRTSVPYQGGRRTVGIAPGPSSVTDAAAPAAGTVSELPMLLTSEEAAAMLNIGRTSLYRLVWSGRLAPLRIGRSVRFTREQLSALVADLASES